PVALGQETTASPAPGTPVVTGVIPNPDDPKGVSTWTGTQVIVNYEPNGTELAFDQCRLFINGQEQELIRPPSEVPAISRATSGIQFKWDTRYEKGDYDFRVELVTMTGETVGYEWSFASEGRAGAGQLFSFNVMRTWFRFIAEGAINTVSLTVISIVLASILALLGALGRLSKKMTFKQAWERYGSWPYMWRMALGRIPYLIATFYTSLFRGTPLLLQIIFIYQVTPEVIQRFGFSPEYNPPAFWAGVAALSLNYGAYLTEVFRAGIQAVPKGQTEAAWALGLSGWQTQRRIILPQAFKIVIPAVGNDFIALIKDTSLVSVITVEELLRRAQLAGAATFNFLSTLVVAAAFYWALTIFFSFWQAKLERRMERDKARE
ncbi:MAG: amino acid ABC transporter permease, partial [Thermoleophilia bacterium]|nr:amino acid ABC transporter permease [Thermoleophilia bacterium]